MKGKLYVFGIGGTGSRVIRSLIMLAASGVKIDASAIVPIIIDPDFANADLTRCIESIKTYNSIRQKLSFNDSVSNRFFKLPVENVVDDYRLSLKDTKNKKFRDFIEYSTLSKENKALASILFSESNLESDMEVGFKGNPNIGSVVLNQFVDSKDFLDFVSSFKSGDRIFIVSSIFGGTGASGFPLLLKNIRGLDSGMPNSDAVSHAPIGAITVLPYFDIKPVEESAIDSSTFIGKTKAALQYYEKNVTGDKSSVNVMYYIGDRQVKQYDNNEGGDRQKNNAHLIEMAAALSIADFASIPDGEAYMSCNDDSNNKIYAPDACFREFGIEDDVPEILYGNLCENTREILSGPSTQFVLFSKYVTIHLKSALSQPWAKDNKIDETFLKSSFASNVKKIATEYLSWLTEMSGNARSFKPYTLSADGDNLYSIVDGVKPGAIKSLWAFNKSGYDLFDGALNEKQGSLSNNYTSEQKFFELFWDVTKMLVEKKYKF